MNTINKTAISFTTSAGGANGQKNAKEIVKLGATLERYLSYAGGNVQVPAHLKIEEHGMRGIEGCTDCGKMANMGHFSITNTNNQTSMSLPYIAVHALSKHGNASYKGTLHQGEVDVDLLKTILN